MAFLRSIKKSVIMCLCFGRTGISVREVYRSAKILDAVQEWGDILQSSHAFRLIGRPFGQVHHRTGHSGYMVNQVNKNLRLDGGVYIGVTGAADDWHPWVGMTWRFRLSTLAVAGIDSCCVPMR